jgi:hypothetical protein
MARSFLVLPVVLQALVTASAAEPFVRLDDYGNRDLQVVGFDITRPTQVTVAAVGVRGRWGSWGWGDDRGWSDGHLALAWLLDSRTRKVVWTQERARETRNDDDDDRWTRRVDDTIELQPGRYELYAWAGWHGGVNIFGRSVGITIHRADKDDYHSSGSIRRAFRDCYVELSADGLTKDNVPRFEPTGEIPGAVFRAAGLGDEVYKRAGLRVDRPMSVRVYALGEMPNDWRYAADGGWITNTVTRERVWEMGRRDVDDGGGAEKNRIFDDEIKLEPGRYEIVFGTDDSHSTEEWNAAPPYDPLNWGVTILPGKDFDAAAFHVSDLPERAEPIIDLTRARDDDLLEKGFRLARETEVQVYAIGEWNDGADEFADAGSIIDARNGKVVWEMTERNTHAAGGAEKNRMFDGTVRLGPGEYIARFETDDSHAYREWNAEAPWDRDAWGMALYPGLGSSAADFVVSDVSTADLDGATMKGDAMVLLTRVRDDEHRRDKFTLDTDGRVHIRALGEGDDGEMYDYAWIENDRTGKVVWEMTWRNTRHAGGARKNRIYDDDVSLDAGTYEVHYVTDGSHSYRRWNAGKPRDPDAWGVTITRAER